MLVVGEFFGISNDKNIWEYFCCNWKHFFPKIGDRSAFTRKASSLVFLMNILQKNIGEELGSLKDPLHISDGFPIPVMKFKRARRTSHFKGNASYRYCAAKGETYYGFKGHILINSVGVVTSYTFTAANIDERDVLPELSIGLKGLMLADKGLIRPSLTEELLKQNLFLQPPVRKNMEEKRDKDYLKWMKKTRRLVETVIGQLTDRFHIEMTKARNIFKLSGRFTRKILSHTIGLFLNKRHQRPILILEGLVG